MSNPYERLVSTSETRPMNLHHPELGFFSLPSNQRVNALHNRSSTFAISACVHVYVHGFTLDIRLTKCAFFSSCLRVCAEWHNKNIFFLPATKPDAQ